MTEGNPVRAHLEIAGLHRAYLKDRPVLSELDLRIGSGVCYGLVGASGSGKTTLLRLIAGLDRPDAGTIALAGRVLTQDGTCVPSRHRRVGFVFQDLALWPHMTAEQNVGFMFPGRLRRVERRARARRLLERICLGASRAGSYPDEMSGGECQRVAIARALASEPEVLLMDEPFAQLDVDLKEEMFSTMEHLRSETPTTIVYVSHARHEVERLADRVGVLSQGRIREES